MTGEIACAAWSCRSAASGEGVGRHAGGIKTVMLPARNRRDWRTIPEETRAAPAFVWLETVDQASPPRWRRRAIRRWRVTATCARSGENRFT